ncbi:MAG: histidine kinase [Bacteroidia bacterium]|nr:histidine kinase [Bacteroidia bacterium]
METLSKTRLYWLCQLGGWFIFIGLEIISYIRIDGYNSMLLTNALVNFILGILITHMYRLFVIKNGWLDLPLTKLLPRAIVTVAIMVTILTAINIPLDRLTYPFFKQIDITVGFFLGYFFNLSKYVLLWTLTYHLFQYWERFLNTEKEKYQLQATIKEIAFQNLKNQLNPHFLFNSLNSIRTLIDTEPLLAKKAITELSGLLRSTLSTDNYKTVPLSVELQMVNHYLAIESIRFDERLQWKFEIDDDALNCQVPPMMLQTLMENAIKHGISKQKNGGGIHLKITKVEKALNIVLLNTGVYEPEKTESGVGIENTKKRLQLLYENDASFSVSNTEDNRVQTKIILPL